LGNAPSRAPPLPLPWSLVEEVNRGMCDTAARNQTRDLTGALPSAGSPFATAPYAPGALFCIVVLV